VRHPAQGVEHRVLKAGVHRLSVSDANPRPSIFRRPADHDRNGTILRAATIRPIDLRVRTLRTQAAINNAPTALLRVAKESDASVASDPRRVMHSNFDPKPETGYGIT
jgi:hypothetical protein